MALEFVSEVDKKFFNDNLLFTEDWDDGGGRLPDDLKELLDVDANLTSDDLMKEFSDNLEIPMIDDLGTNQFVEPWHFSDSSDSGLDCGMSIKEEPLSPSSSDASEHSLDTYNQMSLDDTLQGLILPDDVKLESPLGTQDILGESMALASVPMDTMDTVMTTTDSSILSLGVPMVTVAPSNAQVQKSVGVKTNDNLTQVLNSKVKIKPKPLPTISQATIPGSQVVTPALPAGSGKPLVLTAEEFAKLTSQGVLKIQSPAQSTTNTTPIVAAKPVFTSPVSQVKQIISPVAAPAVGVDSKAIKRQQRMIKNRESACLSRKRKKEYLASMEDRLRQYLQENEKLKHANSQLKKKVEHLESENQRLKGGIHFNPNVKKASILLGVMLLFAVNFYPMASILQGPNSLPSNAESRSVIHHGRTLMSVKDDTPDPSAARRPPPADPYTIIRESLRRGVRKDLIARNALGEYTIPISMCPSYFNSTESSRLMDELNGWVLGHKTERNKKQQQENEGSKQQEQPKLKLQRKLRKNRKQQRNNPARDVTENSISEGRYEIQLFTGADTNYQELFNAIHRRNDTFYVVSFRRDHLLLPATSHNKTMRPRMSLVMPAVNLNDSLDSGPGDVSMMQIDCEVMNTRLVHVANSAVPLEMRETRNSTQKDWPKTPPPTWPNSHSSRHVPRR